MGHGAFVACALVRTRRTQALCERPRALKSAPYFAAASPGQHWLNAGAARRPPYATRL
jgi:hypothetical protein